MEQCDAQGIEPVAIVHSTSSGGTHAGLLAGRALMQVTRESVPEVLAIGVAKGVIMGLPDITDLTADTVELIGGDRSIVDRNDVRVDPDWIGDDYGVPTRAGDAAIRWAARHGGWVLDRVYSGKGFAGLIGNAEAGRWGGGDVIFLHTGGIPTLFAPGGVPD
jgi:1-aminocyclopropane-1-carboxylate deaminase/D-cysteine desulfhydrase-like pyridoxal-dependent ACC family enzyme